MAKTPSPTGTWSGRVFLDAGAYLYVGPGAAAEAHAHHAVQLVWSRDQAVVATIAGRRVEAGALLVGTATAHALAARGPTALLLVEAHGPRGRALDRAARELDGADVSRRLAAVGFPSTNATPTDAAAWCDAVVRALAGAVATPTVSARTRRAIAYVERHLDGRLRVTDAAAHLGCSPTRLTHVFTREVGIPFRRFVLWSRIKRAVEAVQRGADLTQAAFQAGFSDAAHLSRTFREMFGISPSSLLAHVELIGDVWAPLGSR